MRDNVHRGATVAQRRGQAARHGRGAVRLVGLGPNKGDSPMRTNTKGKQVAVVIGATSKWQAEGRNTLLAHGHPVDDSELPVGVRWGVGGAVAQKFAEEGFFTVLTTRNEKNAAPLASAIREQGGESMIVELDLVSQDSIASAFATIRRDAGDTDVLIYNPGYLQRP